VRAKAILAVYFLVAAWAIALFMTRPANPPFPLAVLHGEAPAPMAYRVLSPLCMGAISKLTGDWAKAAYCPPREARHLKVGRIEPPLRRAGPCRAQGATAGGAGPREVFRAEAKQVH
jgi:hypothetical protein